MKKLIIHPRDKSTEFLKDIYSGWDNKKVVRGGVNKEQLRKLIDTHDQVIMMGHGSPYGLFAVNAFSDGGYLGYCIDDTFRDQLAERDNNVAIWCMADQFMNRLGLQGFFTGMFVSEVLESQLVGLRGVTQTIVDESNWAFANIINGVARLTPHLIRDVTMSKYGKVAAANPVAAYNYNRLYAA